VIFIKKTIKIALDGFKYSEDLTIKPINLIKDGNNPKATFKTNATIATA
jgi:hypothetical protein